MRILPVLLLSLLSASPLLADLVLVQDVDTMGQKMLMTMKVKGDLTRMDMNPQMSMILDSKTGDILNLMHGQKIYMKMNLNSMQGMIDQMAKANPAGTAKAEIKATGAKENINGYDTEEYVVTKGNTVSHLWVAKDFPNYEKVREAMEAMKKGPLSKINDQMQADMDLLPGMPIKTTVEINGKPSATVILQSVTEKDLDPSEFLPPADYKTFEMPQMPGMPQTPAPAAGGGQ